MGHISYSVEGGDAADIRDIVALTITYAAAIDHRDWDLLATLFTDPFDLDMSSVSGRPPSTISPTAWAGRISDLGRLDATQHLITNHQVTLDRPVPTPTAGLPQRTATCRAEVRAQHWLSPEHLLALDQPAGTVGWYELGGHYTCAMTCIDQRWWISGYALVIRWRTGNEQVFELAERLATRR